MSDRLKRRWYVIRGRHRRRRPIRRVTSQFVSGTSIDQEKELQADQFSIQQIATDDKQLLDVIRMLVELINADIRSSSKKPLPAGVGLIYDYNSNVAYEYTMQDTRPEYVVRCIRMLQLEDAAGRLNPVAGPGLSHLVNDFAERMRKVRQ